MSDGGLNYSITPALFETYTAEPSRNPIQDIIDAVKRAGDRSGRRPVLRACHKTSSLAVDFPEAVFDMPDDTCVSTPIGYMPVGILKRIITEHEDNQLSYSQENTIAGLAKL